MSAPTHELPRGPTPLVRNVALRVLEGPSRGLERTLRARAVSLGSHEGNDLVLADPTVSRCHAEITIDGGRLRLRDLGSKNGTALDGVEVTDAFVRHGSLVRLGASVVQVELGGELAPAPQSTRAALGTLRGDSPLMRCVFALLERASTTDVTVLLEGETGTGKSQAAEALHQGSRRAAGPFVVFDCAAVPATLVESELMGHERGAFTGADARRTGVLEAAHGGTLFLDEIGELPLELQPKLLRALEERTIRRLGGTATIPIDVRLVAATHRDLRHEVNAGRFRADLYYRLAVVRAVLPPLRQRPEDIPLVARTLLSRMGAAAAEIDALLGPALCERLRGAAWPGNVRELRNYLERCLVLQAPQPLGDPGARVPTPLEAPATLPLGEARKAAVDAFERRYLEALLARCDGRIGRAAEAAGINRVQLYRLLVKHGLRQVGGGRE